MTVRKQQMRSVGSTAVAKFAVMATSGLIGILTTRVILENYGTDAYAQYGLLTGLRELMPFADLGVGAAVITAVASSRHPSQDDVVRRTLLSAFRIVLLSAVVIALLSVTLTVLGLWRPLLGDAMTEQGQIPAMVALFLFGLGVPLAVGQRILVGLGRTSRQIMTQFVVAPVMFLLVSLSVALAAPAGSWLAAFSYFANALAGGLCLWQAGRLLRPQLRQIVRQVLRPREFPGIQIMDVAWPVLLQTLLLPIALGTDRLLLSHLAPESDLVEYILAAQLFGIVLQTVAAAGVALWPVFARNRATATVQTPWPMCLVFVSCGTLLAVGLSAASPWVVDVASGGRVELPLSLLLAFSAYVAVESAKYPLGMYMTDVRGLRFQVGPIIAMVPLKIGVAVALIPLLGAAGTVWSTVLAIGLCQVLANVWWIRRDLRRRRVDLSRQASGTRDEASVEDLDGP